MKPATHRIRRGLEDLGHAMYRERRALHDLRMLPLGENIAPQETPIPDGDAPGWRAIAPSDSWGGYDQNAWFHGEAQIPPQWNVAQISDQYAVVLRLLLGVSRDFGWPEGLLYVNGRLLQGINQHHPDVLLPDEYAQYGPITFDVRAWSGILARQHRLEYAEVALLNRQVEALYHLLLAGCDLVDALEADDPLVHPLWQALEDAWDRVDLRRPMISEPVGTVSATVVDSASEALAALRARLAELRARYDAEARPAVVAIGHGHLDVAWLWQTRHTREKAARTFSIAAALMDRYPEYHFLHTTPQVFAWLADDYPEVFARAKQRIAEGRFEAAGALWLESDTNIVSGESLVRQIMYGQRYLRETFGAEYDALWLPDTFGYSYALPQIMLRAGLRAFMTTKMSWSDTNRIPYDTFRWRGLDGSETLAHFVTTPWLPIDPDFNTDTYNARLDAPSVLHLWRRYRSKPHNQELLLIYGHGDGGAGPTRQHIESYRALRELPGLPTVTLGRADEYFHRLRERVWSQPDLPRWDGELYLEYHRGVYTTQAWLKRLHRRIEEQLLLAESLDATRWASARMSGGSPPDERATLDDAWRQLLLHEFHDILPGSSIGQVYADARAALTTLAARLDAFIAQAERDIADRDAAAGAWLIHNPSPLATPGDALVALPLTEDEEPPALINSSARTLRLPMQVVQQPDGSRVALYQTPAIEGRGWLALRQGEPEPPHSRPADALRPSATANEDGGAILENALYRLTLNAAGEITSLLDKRVAGGRELMQVGRVGNQFIAFEDRPRRFDAWDIDAGYTHKPYAMEAAKVTVTEQGPLRASVCVRRRLLGSVIEQDISLYASLPRIDFATRVDWYEQHLLLKVAFPLDLRVTQARSEIQYGSISRPTHENTSWDQARFETVAHRWVDLSEGDYGVALLNDGRYGHDIRENVVRLTVLRSPTMPDPDADQGAHEVTFSLLPHLVTWPAGDVTAHGYTLNRPPRLIHLAASQTASQMTGQPAPVSAPQPLFAVDAPAVVIEAVKRAAEGDDLIVRLYESTGSRVAARIACGHPIASVVETDLLERPLVDGVSPAFDLWQASPVASHDAPETDDDGWRCQFRPFELRTFRVTLRLP
ncbi:MAG TPA: glycoside hydrolase family 38 C-terminal domain-containing protein [Ktedonobacterales bacterium]|nr:glycoside hydrolase family 38 C-terminal domain-containing protein [Ktedonobacterales bacterium]